MILDSYDKVVFSNYYVNSYKELWNSRKRYGLHRIHFEDFQEVVGVFTAAYVREDCSDNARVFPYNQRRSFDAIAAKGCCGSANWSHTCKSGRKYLLGFNYGH